jgi:hypothetical protein
LSVSLSVTFESAVVSPDRVERIKQFALVSPDRVEHSRKLVVISSCQTENRWTEKSGVDKADSKL